jgi:site-specific recombinase XerD
MAAKSFLENFAQELRDQDRSDNTVLGYLTDVKDFQRWFEQTNGENFSLPSLTPTDIREYRQHLWTVRKLSPNTVNRRLASLAALTTWGMTRKQIQVDPMSHIKYIKQVPVAECRWLDKKQRFALQRVIEKELQESSRLPVRRSLWRGRDAVLVTLMLNTGLRVAEVAALDVGDVELNPRSGRIQVRGKGRKARTVPLNAEAREKLQAWLATRPATETSALFVSQMLTRVTTRTVERVVTDYGYRARLEQLTPHTLRHTFAKSLVDRGVPIDQVAKLLGHSNLNTTRIYTEPNERDLEKAVDMLVES